MVQPAANAADSLYADEVARARAMGPSDKLLDGPHLFERACRLMRDGIRHQHPAFSDEASRRSSRPDWHVSTTAHGDDGRR